MEIKKLYFPLAAVVGAAILVTLFVLGAKLQHDHLQANQGLLSRLHKLRFALASASEALSNAVITPQENAAHEYGSHAFQRVQEFKAGLRQVEQELQDPQERELLREASIAFERFEKVCHELVAKAKSNSNRKAYALAVGPCWDTTKLIDGQLAELLKQVDTAADESHQGHSRELYEARLALCRTQSLLIRHVFAPSDPEMDALESELQIQEARIKSSLSSPPVTADLAHAPRLAEIHAQLQQLDDTIKTLLDLSRENSNVHAEDIAMSTRLEATLDCDKKLTALEELLQKRLESLVPKGRSN